MANADVPRINIMISSTRADLAQYREEASRIIKRVAAEKEKRVQLVEVSMEKEVQSGEREFPVAVSKRWVEESNWVVVIVGWHYGTITEESGANGLSVTEWEYQHAIEQHKRIFVFIAGSPGTANQYRVSAEERNDLKDWIPRQLGEQQEKLTRFREELGKRHAELFANLQMFRERLEKTLKDAIDDLRLDIQPGSTLAELIMAVTPAIRDCIRRVTLIANCKRTHDCLHEIHQQVIRRLQEEVLPHWLQERTLNSQIQKSLLKRIFILSKQLGALEQLSHDITPDHSELRHSVGNVINKLALWDIESESEPSVDEFGDRLDSFAIVVQHAFWEADRSMVGEERVLDELYAALMEGISDARRQRHLSPSDDRKLDDRLQEVRAMTSHLAKTLKTHHAWQEAHDAMMELDGFRGTTRFRTKLSGYCETRLKTLIELVEKELAPTSTQTTSVAAGSHASQTTVAGHEGQPFPLDASNYNDPTDDLRHLLAQLEVLCESKEERECDAVRRPFDDAFYCIDKRTLAKVEQAHERVKAVEALLDELANARRKTG